MCWKRSLLNSMPQRWKRLGRVGDAVIFRVSNEKCINAWTGNHVIMKRSTLAGTKLRKEQRNRNLDAKLGTLARCKCEAYQFFKKPWEGDGLKDRKRKPWEFSIGSCSGELRPALHHLGSWQSQIVGERQAEVVPCIIAWLICLVYPMERIAIPL